MIAAYLERAGKFSVQEVDEPEYGPDDALVKVCVTGIYGSNLHYIKEGRIKNNNRSIPGEIIPGCFFRSCKNGGLPKKLSSVFA